MTMPPPDLSSRHHQRDGGVSKRVGHHRRAFTSARRPNGIVCCPPPSCHFSGYCTGGLGNLYDEIRSKRQPVLHEFGTFTSSKGRFKPHTNMPLLALRYCFVEIISEGQSCIVIKALDTFRRNRDVAIKVLHLHYCKLGTQEVDVIRQLNQADPYHFSAVLRLQNTFMFDEHFCLVFDFYDPAAIIDYVRDLNGYTRLEFIRKVSAKLVQCLGFLHSQNVIHADLKVENILLAKAHDPSSLKLVDFGNAIHCVHNEMSLYYSDFELQTLLYRAPEVLYGLSFGMEVDMWSLGIVLAQLYIGRPLVVGKTKALVLDSIVNLLGPLPRRVFQCGKFYRVLDKFTENKEQCYAMRNIMNRLGCWDFHFCDFIAGLLKYDPSRRLTPLQAASHSFLGPVLGLSHLTSHYPLVPISSSSYKHRPFIGSDVDSMHLNPEDPLQIGTIVETNPEPTPTQLVKYDRLDALRNRSWTHEKEDGNSGNGSYRSTQKHARDEMSCVTPSDISSTSNTAVDCTSELNYVSPPDSERRYVANTNDDTSRSCDSTPRLKEVYPGRPPRGEKTRDENFNIKRRKSSPVKSVASIPSGESAFNQVLISPNTSGNGSTYQKLDNPKLLQLSSGAGFSGKVTKVVVDLQSPSCREVEEIMSRAHKDAVPASNVQLKTDREASRKHSKRGVPVRRRNQEKVAKSEQLPDYKTLPTLEHDSGLSGISNSDPTPQYSSSHQRRSPQESASIQRPASSRHSTSLKPPSVSQNEQKSHSSHWPSKKLKDLESGPSSKAPSLDSNIMLSTPIVKSQKTGRVSGEFSHSGITQNPPDFGNISPISEQAPIVPARRNLLVSKSNSAPSRKRSRNNTASIERKMSRRSILLQELFGEVSDSD